MEDGELIHYVGETGDSFAKRMLDHFKEHASGGYHLYSPEPYSEGRKICLWPGRYDRDSRTFVSDFVFKLHELWPAIVALAKTYRFYLAPLACDRRLRRRIEAAIASTLYEQLGIAGDFLGRGIRYSSRRNDEAPLSVAIESSVRLIGLPEVLEV